jgi:hypothetical protein
MQNINSAPNQTKPRQKTLFYSNLQFLAFFYSLTSPSTVIVPFFFSFIYVTFFFFG